MKVCLQCEHVFTQRDWKCSSCGYHPPYLNGIEAHAPEFAQLGGGFKPEYFSDLSKLERENFWFRARNEIILWALKSYKPDAKNFLEVGCGTGFVLSAMEQECPDLMLSGSEVFLAGLLHAADRVPSVHLMQMDARRVPFIEEFDAIGAFDVLEHIEEDGVVLGQLYRAIKPGGVLLLTVPQHPWLWSVSDEYACHVRRYTAVDIEQKILKAGFKCLRSSSFVTSLLPLMMLSRILQDRNIDNFDPGRELKVNPLLNSIFYGLMKFEFTGLKLGMNYPVGGSRLIVAGK